MWPNLNRTKKIISFKWGYFDSQGSNTHRGQILKINLGKMIYKNYHISNVTPSDLMTPQFNFKQLTDFSNYRNFVNITITGNLVKIFSFSEKINLELSIVSRYLPKNNPLRSQNLSQKVKNDSWSSYAKVQYIYIVSICHLLLLLF